MKPRPRTPGTPRKIRLRARLVTGLLGTSMLWILPAYPQVQDGQAPPLSRTNDGTVGLIELPSARMADDGTLSAGASFFKSTQHYNLGFQILPWLEGSFRYSGIAHFAPDYPIYWDRSFGMKLRLWEEGQVRPAVALGINDLVGTGLYSGEYLVASKQFGAIDTTLGIGFGRLGSANTFPNPLAQVFPSLKARPTLTTPGGTNFGVYFRGPTAGVFGGISWRTPITGLTALVEASSDSYPIERNATKYAGPGFFPRTQFNYGISYQAAPGVSLGLNWLYGRSFGASLSFQFNPKSSPYPGTINAPPPAPVIRSHEEQQEALQVLLQQRGPQPSARLTNRRSRAARRDGFVDALLAQDGLVDIRIAGTTLALTMSGRPRADDCQNLARIIQNSGIDIEQVVIHHDHGRPHHCRLPHATEPMLQSAAFTSALPDFKPPTRDFVTIDAASPSSKYTEDAIRKFKVAATKQLLQIDAASFSDGVATVYYTNSIYFSEADAIERLVRLLMAHAPPTIEEFHLVPILLGIPQQEITVLRAPAERAFMHHSGTASIFDSGPKIAAAPMQNPILDASGGGFHPSFDWHIFPQLRQQFFDPNNPLGIQLLGAISGSVELAPGFSVWGQAEASVFDTFATNRFNDSVLPHVRTDYLKYFSQGKNGIAALEANYRFRLSPELFATLKAGYLESMFAGAGGEILWRPEGQRWAIGADLYDVRQRKFDRLFGLRNYQKFTGHVTLYYASPWYDLDFQLRAGQYLAGDRGVTIQVTRRFSTGVEIGAFMTQTNVSAARFGEGSFDKGIIIRIPLSWIAPVDSQNQISMDLRPVQRDGGQALLGDATLYEETRRTGESEMRRSGIPFAAD